jgi:hypothetical protein
LIDDDDFSHLKAIVSLYVSRNVANPILTDHAEDSEARRNFLSSSSVSCEPAFIRAQHLEN